MTEIPALQLEEIDFAVEKEVWNIYELADSSILKVRTVLVKLLRRKIPQSENKPLPAGVSPPTEEFSANFQHITSVTKTKLTLMGKPTPPAPPEEMENMAKTEVAFTPFIEDWNIYNLPDGDKLKVKVNLSSVYRVNDHYDELGYPVYIVNSTNALIRVTKPAKK